MKILYVVAWILFAFMTFGIVKNYYKSKFDEDGRREDMKGVGDEDIDKKSKR